MDLIRSLLVAARRSFELDKPWTIRGKVVEVAKASRRFFLTVADPTDVIQVVLPRDAEFASPPPQRNQRWEFVGTLDATSFFKKHHNNLPVPSLVATSARPLSDGSAHAESTADDDADGIFVGALVLAQLRHAATRALTELGYTELEPKLITLAAPISGLEPMHVNYVGFGSPAHLFPSPASQLRQLLAATYVEAAFAISRVFTTTYRDESTSTEALTAMAMRVRPGSTDLSARPFDLERALRYMWDEKWLRIGGPENFSIPDPLLMVSADGAPKPHDGPVSTVRLEAYGELPTAAGDLTMLPVLSFHRLVVPKRSILAERVVVKWTSHSVLEVTTLHLERFAATVPKSEVRRFQTLLESPVASRPRRTPR